MPRHERYWIALRSVRLVGNITFRRLLERFESPERVFHESLASLAATPGVSPHAARAILDERTDALQQADRILARLERIAGRIVTIQDSDYPPLLREIFDPPPFLYCLGNLPRVDRGVAIVGSRRAGRGGKELASRLAADLASAGYVIVSGFARGIDTAAHLGALDAAGETIAVLGCGIDVVYPPENRLAYDRICRCGCVVSEYEPGTPPLAEHFPRRNRIVSGISQGVVVVEASEKSGTLITARYALEQGRELFAVPGPVTAGTHRGCHWLIKQGARLVESAADVLEELSPDAPLNRSLSPQPFLPMLSRQEHDILDLVTDAPLTIDQLVEATRLTPAELSSILLRLELEGVIHQLPGKMFVKS